MQIAQQTYVKELFLQVCIGEKKTQNKCPVCEGIDKSSEIDT